MDPAAQHTAAEGPPDQPSDPLRAMIFDRRAGVGVWALMRLIARCWSS